MHSVYRILFINLLCLLHSCCILKDHWAAKVALKFYRSANLKRLETTALCCFCFTLSRARAAENTFLTKQAKSTTDVDVCA